MEVVNLTPHEITLGNTTIPQTKGVHPIRIHYETKVIYTVNDIPVKLIGKSKDSSQPLPPIKPGTLYVVSRFVADAYREREDFVFMSDFVRDHNGAILGCKSLARFE